jgi:hypothetical protein
VLATTLPAAAPLLCGILHPAMAMLSHTEEHGTPGAEFTAQAPPQSCDFGRCGTAPVAPTAHLRAAVAVLRLHAAEIPGPGPGIAAPAPPPLTPPPQA